MAPLFVEIAVFSMWGCMLIIGGLVLTSQSLDLIRVGPLVPLTVLACVMPFAVGLHIMRRTLYHKHLLLEGLAMFDLRHAQCRLESDRDFVHKAIIDWYGTAEAFTDYVRGPLHDELLKSSLNFTIPAQYYAIILLGFVSESLDELLGLVVARAPWRSIIGHLIGHTIGMSAWVIIALELLAYISYRWAAPRKSWALNVGLSFLSFLPFPFYIGLGSSLTRAAVRRGLRQSFVIAFLSTTASFCTVRFNRLHPGQ
ncbi:HMCN1, partial [Symbiodinium pilosum]